MEITLEIILYALSMDTTLYTNLSMDEKHVIRWFDVWENGLPQKECLYLVEKETLLQDLVFWKNKCVICRGLIEQEILQQQEMMCICMSDRISLHEIAQQVQNVFHKYYRWMFQTERMAAQGQPLDMLLEFLEKEWRIRSCIASRSMKILGITKSFGAAHDWVDMHRAVDLQTVNELVVDEEFQKASENTQTFLYMDTSANWYYCYNFFIAEQYEARLLADVAEQKNYGICELLNAFGDCISTYYQKNYGIDQAEDSRKKLKKLMHELWEGKKVGRGEIQKVLSDYHWESSNSYRLILFQFQEGAKAGIGQSYYRYQIEMLFPASLVLEEEGDYICVQNMSLLNKKEDADKNMPYFLRETLCKAGISRIFTDFGNFKNYHPEAEPALILGMRVQPTKWSYRFADYVMEYMIEQCIRELTPQEVCHPALEILEKYDQKNDTCLVETLRVYLQQRHNVTHTAELLYIHRTSLLFRLDRIRQLTGLDLEDYQTCLHLMLSFEIKKTIKE